MQDTWFFKYYCPVNFYPAYVVEFIRLQNFK